MCRIGEEVSSTLLREFRARNSLTEFESTGWTCRR